MSYYTTDQLMCELTIREYVVKRSYDGYSEIPFLYFDYRRTYMPIHITTLGEYGEYMDTSDPKPEVCREYLNNADIGSELIFPAFNVVNGELTHYVIYSKIDSENWEQSNQYFKDDTNV